MAQDGRAIANYILDRCSIQGRSVTNLSLQKIVYFCHAWTLAQLGRPLVRHQFEAWKYGPVLQYLYRDFKEFDGSPITSRAKKIDPNTGRSELVTYDFDAETKALLDNVIDFYIRIKPGTLVELSHTDGGPWDLVWNHSGDVNPGMKISDKIISDYFSSKPPPF